MDYNRQIHISTAGSRKARHWPTTVTTWAEFAEKLKIPVRGEETLEAYLALSKTQQDDLKDVGGFVGGTFTGGRRKASCLAGRDLATLDLDSIPAGQADEPAAYTGCVFLMDKPEDIMRKFKRAITDSDTERCVRYTPDEKPGVANLMQIYAAATGKTYGEIEREFDGQGYGKFKPAVGEAVVEMIRPIQEETRRILADKAYLEGVYRAGAEKASYVAERTLRKVYKKIGFIAR